MPTYDYKCMNCGLEIEIMQNITDEPFTVCVECNQETLKRGIGGGSSLHFKGTGFYVNDYKGK